MQIMQPVHEWCCLKVNVKSEANVSDDNRAKILSFYIVVVHILKHLKNWNGMPLEITPGHPGMKLMETI